MTKQSFEGLTCLTLSTVGGGWGAGFGMIFRGVIGGLTRLDIDKGLEGLVGKQAEFSRGQASPHAVHLVHGGGDEVNDGGDEADGQPGIEEEKCQGQADWKAPRVTHEQSIIFANTQLNWGDIFGKLSFKKKQPSPVIWTTAVRLHVYLDFVRSIEQKL